MIRENDARYEANMLEFADQKTSLVMSPCSMVIERFFPFGCVDADALDASWSPCSTPSEGISSPNIARENASCIGYKNV